MDDVVVPQESPESARIHTILDDFHAAAATADEKRYLAHFAPEGVFLGTAQEERWGGADFRAFVRRMFSRGRGWTYTVSRRSVDIASDGRAAWFDERLENDFYGECRGTGVVQLQDDGAWRIEQYNLSVPIPNELAAEIVARIRESR